MALKNVFKKKEGGTKIGNFLRGAAETATAFIPGVGPIISKGIGKANEIYEKVRDKKLAVSSSGGGGSSISIGGGGGSSISIGGGGDSARSDAGGRDSAPSIRIAGSSSDGNKIIDKIKALPMAAKIGIVGSLIGGIIVLINKNKKSKRR